MKLFFEGWEKGFTDLKNVGEKLVESLNSKIDKFFLFPANSALWSALLSL